MEPVAVTPRQHRSPDVDRTRMALAAGGVGLFVVAGLLVHGAGDSASSAAAIPCPFRALTGLPCPLCGATRSVGLLAQASPDFLRYNPVWAVLLVAGTVLAAVTALSPATRARVRGAPRPPRPVVAGLIVLVVALAWTVALVNRAAIVG